VWRVGVDSGGTFTDICLVDEATGDVRVFELPSTPDDPSRPIVYLETIGAGGYGDPRERDRALVERDVAEGAVSGRVAREVYGR